MSSSGFTAEVTNLSSEATKKDVHKFFEYCGPIQNIKILREGKPVNRAYVTFKDFHALEISIVLSGSVILDRAVEITPHDIDMRLYAAVSHPGEAVVLATEVVKTMADKGYKLSKDACQRAKAFDDSYRLSAKTTTAVLQGAKTAYSVASAVVNSTIVAKGASAAYSAGSAVVNSTIVAKGASTASSAASAVGNTASSAASAVVNGTVAVVNSTVVAKGALLLSGVFGFASKAASDFGNRNS